MVFMKKMLILLFTIFSAVSFSENVDIVIKNATVLTMDSKRTVIENGVLVEQGLVSEIFANPRTKTTREFLRNISHSGDERSTDSSFVRWTDKGGKFELRFKGDSPGKPILSQAAKKFDVDFSNIKIHVNEKFNLAKNEAKTNTFDIFFDKNKNKYFV